MQQVWGAVAVALRQARLPLERGARWPTVRVLDVDGPEGVMVAVGMAGDALELAVLGTHANDGSVIAGRRGALAESRATS